MQPYGELAWMANAQVTVSVDPPAPLRCNLAAVEGDILRTRSYRLAAGRWVGLQNEVVLGAGLAESLFQHKLPLGETVLLGDNLHPFTIVGVLEPRPTYIIDFDFDRDHALYISWSDHKAVMPTDQFLPRVFFRGVTPTATRLAADMMRYQLDDSNLQAEQLILRNPREGLERTKRLTEAYNLFSAAMALVTIAVNGATVAALTLIYATDMQNKLAIKRACGATKQGIFNAILQEVLGLIIVTIAIGLVIVQPGLQWWARRSGLPAPFSWGLVLIGLMCSSAITVVAAIWPAWRMTR